MRALLVHPPLDPCIHNAGIGEDESHLSAIVPKEQIEVPADPILIHRGVGAGTVRVDRIGTGIGDMLLQDSAVIAVRVDAGHRAVAVKMILASEGEMDLLTILKPETSTVIHIGPFQRSQRAGVFAPCLLGVSRSPAEEPYDQEHPHTNLSLHSHFLPIGKRVNTHRACSVSPCLLTSKGHHLLSACSRMMRRILMRRRQECLTKS